MGISIHAPTRGATASRRAMSTLGRFQSTRPRGARLAAWLSEPRQGWISIHAPTRGATTSSNPKHHKDGISIHAPTRGATIERFFMRCKGAISIHAPTRGATEHGEIRVPHAVISIHAPTRGATSQASTRASIAEFQSTRPRGARRHRITMSFFVHYFNPRGARRLL